MGIEQRLEQPEVSANNPQLAKLQRRAIEMATYYYKGFGGIHGLDGILNLAEAYLILSNSKERKRELAYENLQTIEQVYAAIPFSELEGKEDFLPLFKVRPLVATLQTEMGIFFSNPTRESLENLRRLLVKIKETGTPYFETLIQLTTRIRTFPEAHNFRVAIPDRYTGYVYRW